MSGAPKLLLDFQELADALGVTLATIYRLRERGELPLPVVRIGRGPRVRTVDVEAWLARLAEEAEEEKAPASERHLQRASERRSRPGKEARAEG